MPLIRNTNPTGDIWNKHTGFLSAGDTVEVSDEVAAELLEQVGNFEIAKPAKPAKTED